ncbi:DDE-type integrase/transposase/recombinase [Arthrobacter sp. TB 23]|uniref:DDE-type integrase/transposase/recombinase n=1 Tax=Arthrobacter sp. TB 23 TaxID=494419 RepID=UPI000367A5E7|nr:DDE-type integrase/transposase/recombinase [Arthrobacter sp. TB 23]
MRALGYAVESICAVLREQGVQVAARTYLAWKTRLPALRTLEDARVTDALRALNVADAKGRRRPEILYGRRKMTQWLRRNGFPEASKHTVDRLMREEGMNGLIRGRKMRTTVPGKDGRRAGDLLNRDFIALTPNQVWVTDFTYVPVYTGFVYVALVIDLYSRAIVGWETSTVKHTTFVEHCLRMALWRRQHTGRPAAAGLIHHSDAGSQGEFNWSSQHLDYGGSRWDAVESSCGRLRRARGGSGRRIGRYVRRCVRRAGQSPLVRCSGSFGV